MAAAAGEAAPVAKVSAEDDSITLAGMSDLSQVTAVLGGFFGDEGKGKIVDALAGHFDVVCRFNGGSNAGHSIHARGIKFSFHLLPSGMVSENSRNIVGAGCVVHVPSLMKEIAQLDSKGVEWRGRFFVADRAHLVFNFHQTVDGMQEGSLPQDLKIGTTRKGIGPSYMEKANRSNLRMVDLREIHTPAGYESFKTRLEACVASAQRRFSFEYDIEAELAALVEAAAVLREAGCFVDGVSFIHDALESGKRILLEGANAALLDIDYGTYPFVTSSNTTSGGCATGSGLSVRDIGDIVGVIKAYSTRVGEGPFPTELSDDTPEGSELRSVGHEFGTTTGRPRRCGWLDIPLLRYTTRLNGYTHVNLTKLDVLDGFKEIKIGVGYKLDGKPINHVPASLHELGRVEVEYETLPGWETPIGDFTTWEQLPANAKAYVDRVEELLGGKAKIRWIGTGTGRHNLIARD